MIGNLISSTTGTIGDILTNLKYVPYKAGEPKRFVPILVGLGVIIAAKAISGDSKTKKFVKQFMASFGPTLIGASLAGIINPVTLGGGKRFATTTGDVGYTMGQTDPSYGRTAPGTYYDAPVVTPGVEFFKRTPVQPASSPRDPYLPAVGEVGTRLYNATTGNTGYTTGQTDPTYGRTPPGAYYGAELMQPKRPLLYGNNVVGCNPLTGEGCGGGNNAIYIRDFGEVDFVGGN